MPPKNPSPPQPRSTARKPQKSKYSHSENADQVALAAWLDFRHVVWFHVPNGEHRHVAVAAKLKRMGLKPGVPDAILITPPTKLRPLNDMPYVVGRGRAYVGCALELKRTHGGNLSPHQKLWLEDMSDLGWLCIVARGFDDAVAQLTDAGY